MTTYASIGTTPNMVLINPSDAERLRKANASTDLKELEPIMLKRRANFITAIAVVTIVLAALCLAHVAAAIAAGFIIAAAVGTIILSREGNAHINQLKTVKDHAIDRRYELVLNSKKPLDFSSPKEPSFLQRLLGAQGIAQATSEFAV